MTDNIADWDAAYVLGALSLDDWQTYQPFLAENPGRGVALTELAVLPGILNVLSRDEAVALTLPRGSRPPRQGCALDDHRFHGHRGGRCRPTDLPGTAGSL